MDLSNFSGILKGLSNWIRVRRENGKDLSKYMTEQGKLISDAIHTALRPNGFRRKGANWQGPCGATVMVLNLQKSQYSELYYINAGFSPHDYVRSADFRYQASLVSQRFEYFNRPRMDGKLIVLLDFNKSMPIEERKIGLIDLLSIEYKRLESIFSTEKGFYQFLIESPLIMGVHKFDYMYSKAHEFATPSQVEYLKQMKERIEELDRAPSKPIEITVRRCTDM